MSKKHRDEKTIVLDPKNPAHADIIAMLREGDEQDAAYREWLRTGSPRDLEQATPFCSFCGKSQSEVRRLIAGGGWKVGDRISPRVNVCDACVGLAAEMMPELVKGTTRPRRKPQPRPAEPFPPNTARGRRVGIERP